MRTLKDLLMSIPDNTMLKIGAVNGSSYFYVGTAEDFLDNLETYTEQGYKSFKKTLKSTTADWNLQKEAFPEYPSSCTSDLGRMDISSWLLKIRKGFCTPSENLPNGIWSKRMYRFINDLSNWTIQTEKRRKSAEAAKYRFDHFKPYDKRDIVDTFWATDGVEDGEVLVVHIEGWELGYWWLVSEVKKRPAYKIKANSSVYCQGKEDEEEV